MKNFVKPSNPNSVKQQVVRNMFAVISAAWRSLSPEQKLTFKTFAHLYPVKNKLGQMITLTPRALFQMMNMKALLNTPSGTIPVIISECTYPGNAVPVYSSNFKIDFSSVSSDFTLALSVIQMLSKPTETTRYTVFMSQGIDTTGPAVPKDYVELPNAFSGFDATADGTTGRWAIEADASLEAAILARVEATVTKDLAMVTDQWYVSLNIIGVDPATGATSVEYNVDVPITVTTTP